MSLLHVERRKDNFGNVVRGKRGREREAEVFFLLLPSIFSARVKRREEKRARVDVVSFSSPMSLYGSYLSSIIIINTLDAPDFSSLDVTLVIGTNDVPLGIHCTYSVVFSLSLSLSLAPYATF